MPKSVLIVEDDMEQRALFTQAFMAAGYRVVAVPDGTTALWHTTKESFDVVLADLYLPECQGDLLIREIKCHHPRMKAVLMSCHPEITEETPMCNADLTYYKGDLNQLMAMILDLVASEPSQFH